mgnify:FL=1
MKNRSQSFLIQSSVILVFFFLASLNGQAEIQNSFVRTIKDDAVFISMNSGQILFYYENKVYLGDKIVYQNDSSKIIKVSSLKKKPNHTMVYFIKSTFDSNHIFEIQFLKDMKYTGQSIAVNIPTDRSIPRQIISENHILFLQPENQSYSVYDFIGKKQYDNSLFNNDYWSHEQSLLHSEYKGNHFLLGMETPFYHRVPNNIALFSLNESTFISEKIRSIPLSKPDFFSISKSGLFAIIGSRRQSSDLPQSFFLLLLELNDPKNLTDIPLIERPKFIQWNGEKLYLIHRNQIRIIDSATTHAPLILPFITLFHPIQPFVHDGSVFIFGSKEIEVGPEGIKYQSIIIIEIDGEELIEHIITNGIYDEIRLVPSVSGTDYFIQADTNLFHFTIK